MQENYFGRQAGQYKAVRPLYPDALFAFVAAQTKENDVAVDCGCGNGQATIQLAKHFNSVVGLDESRGQLTKATKNQNVQYLNAMASKLPMQDDSADLIFAATALHWFDLDAFYKEADRVLKPDGTIAAAVYYTPRVDETIDDLTKSFFEERLAHHIDERRRWVMDTYKTISFPFRDKQYKAFAYSTDCTVDRYLGNLGSSSLVQKEIENTGNDPVAEIEGKLRQAWGDPSVTKTATWDIGMIIGKANSPSVTIS